ncbi:hypothetical protein ALC57_16679 [Trachymyrmex cornetzi]|uniref:Uncharacterized protein n=1 Tax=Trachymyrmex cornetzi TaxID=471704 RepID=A0A195DE16_9HYME|nr:hypothetical protein ALC57_16679 [Trachymyrmex cornetzi]
MFVLFGLCALCLIVLYLSLNFYSLLFLSWICIAGHIGIFSRVDASVKCCSSLPMGVAIPYPLVSNRPPICVRLQSLWTI